MAKRFMLNGTLIKKGMPIAVIVDKVIDDAKVEEVRSWTGLSGTEYFSVTVSVPHRAGKQYCFSTADLYLSQRIFPDRKSAESFMTVDFKDGDQVFYLGDEKKPMSEIKTATVSIAKRGKSLLKSNDGAELHYTPLTLTFPDGSVSEKLYYNTHDNLIFKDEDEAVAEAHRYFITYFSQVMLQTVKAVADLLNQKKKLEAQKLIHSTKNNLPFVPAETMNAIFACAERDYTSEHHLYADIQDLLRNEFYGKLLS